MSQPHQKPIIPFGVALLGIATFAAMDVVMKGLSIEMGAYNAILWRTLIGLPMAALLFIWKGNSWPQVSNIKVHVWRGLVISLIAFMFFWGLVHVPLAEAIGLSFIAPLIALYLAVVLLGERISRRSVIASLIGFSGAMVIIAGKLGGEYSDTIGLGMAAIFCSAVLYGYNLILQRQQALLADPVEIALFQNGTILVVYAMLAPFLAIPPATGQLLPLAAAALLGVVSILFLSWAYARAQAKILIPVEYTAFIWAALFGWLVFGEEVTFITLAGTALIVAGCLLAAAQQPDKVDHVEATAL